MHRSLRRAAFGEAIAEDALRFGLSGMKRLLLGVFVAAVCGTAMRWEAVSAQTSESVRRRPNFVVIFLDDAGWADFRPFGRPSYPTPNVERLASEGRVFPRLYVPQAICSASRAALMTGCFPGRTRVFGAYAPRVRGLDPKYATIAEVLKPRGYATAVFGKWHLGDQPQTRPWARGFDEACGLMYSNDMWRHHPENPKFWGRWPLQFWENGRVKIEDVTADDQKMLTTWYTEYAVDFIRRHREKPFFLYVPHSMPHVPIFCSERFRGKSGAGLYGDVMMELDWSVGRILGALKEAGLEKDTVVFFIISDNGPWLSYGNHAGRTPFREGKGTGFDGGIRSACIVRFPGRVPAGTTSDEIFSSLDLLPTLARLAGAKLPENPIDGRDVWDLIRGAPGAENPHVYYPFSTGGRFEGVLTGDGRWKLHLPHPYRTLACPGRDGKPGKYRTARIGWALYDLERDPFETLNLWDEEPEVASRLKRIAEAHRARFFPNQKAAGVGAN